MPANEINIDHHLPDPHSYNVVINKYQQLLIRKALNYAVANLSGTQWLDADEEAMAKCLSLMLNPECITGPLAPHPAINALIL